jgi:hypothetical protein
MNEIATTRLSAPASILGQRLAQVPLGGIIRPGIKILSQAAQQNDTARGLYDRGCAEGKSFDAIEKEIRQAVPSLKSPLRPANVPYFSARRADFPMPELADLLLEKHGEVREDGIFRLYRFPAIFAADAWEQLMPHGLQVWAAGKRKYWSDDNGVRRCKTYGAVPKDAAGRVIRRSAVARWWTGPSSEDSASPNSARNTRTANATWTRTVVHRSRVADDEPGRAADPQLLQHGSHPPAAAARGAHARWAAVGLPAG